LIEITRDILGYKDENGGYVVDRFWTGGQKGTGKWTSVSSARLGHPADADRRGGFRRAAWSAMKADPASRPPKS